MTGAGIRFAPAPWPGLPEEVEVFTRDFMGVAPEELHLPNLFLAWKPHGSTLHWERWEALRQLCLAHETLGMAAWPEAIHRQALQVGVDGPPPDHQTGQLAPPKRAAAWALREGHLDVRTSCSTYSQGRCFITEFPRLLEASW